MHLFLDGWQWPGVLVPLLSGVRYGVDDIVLLEIIWCSGFDPVVSLVAYDRPFEVDWAWVEPAQHCYLYQFF